MSNKIIEEIKRGVWKIEDYREFIKNNKRFNVNGKEFITQMGPLHFAAREGNFELCKILVEKGANLESKSTYGWTPLHIATYNLNKEIVTLLLENGANPNASTRWYSMTPLHLACEENSYDLVIELLKYKADPQKKAKGKIPYELTTNDRIRFLLEEYFRSKEDKPTQKVDLLVKNFDLNLDKHCLLWLDSVIDEKSIPIIYRNENNISFMRLEELHPFDSTKFQKIAKFLVEDGVVKNKDFYIQSKRISDDFLSKLHTREYLDKMKTSQGVSEVIEFYPAAIAPYWLIKNIIVEAMKYQAGGTILAGELALKYGWCIVLGGGMHHASSSEGGGWCAYGDLQLSILNLKDQQKVKKVMIIDLDAHQGNGYQNDKVNGLLGAFEDTFIVDLYGRDMYPDDDFAKQGINVGIELEEDIQTNPYMNHLVQSLDEAFDSFQPDIVFYNAGTDIMTGDPLGRMRVSDEGIIGRDYEVFRRCLEKKIPIVMVTSGGYQKKNARVIADSIKNMYKHLKLGEIATFNYKKNIQPRKKGQQQQQEEEEVFPQMNLNELIKVGEYKEDEEEGENEEEIVIKE